MYIFTDLWNLWNLMSELTQIKRARTLTDTFAESK